MGVAEAMHSIANAVTQCKFEATDPASDEVVLYRILQVRFCLRLPAAARRSLRQYDLDMPSPPTARCFQLFSLQHFCQHDATLHKAGAQGMSLQAAMLHCSAGTPVLHEMPRHGAADQ